MKHKRTPDDFAADMRVRVGRLAQVSTETADRFNLFLPAERKLSEPQKLFLAGLIAGAFDRLREYERNAHEPQ
jgi:hypothetical protein